MHFIYAQTETQCTQNVIACRHYSRNCKLFTLSALGALILSFPLGHCLYRWLTCRRNVYYANSDDMIRPWPRRVKIASALDETPNTSQLCVYYNGIQHGILCVLCVPSHWLCTLLSHHILYGVRIVVTYYTLYVYTTPHRSVEARRFLMR